MEYRTFGGQRARKIKLQEKIDGLPVRVRKQRLMQMAMEYVNKDMELHAVVAAAIKSDRQGR